MSTPHIPPTDSTECSGAPNDGGLNFIDSFTDFSGATEEPFDVPTNQVEDSMNTQTEHPLSSPTLGWQDTGDNASNLLDLDFAPLDEQANMEPAFIQDKISQTNSPVQLVNMQMLEEPANVPSLSTPTTLLDVIPEEHSTPEPAPSTPDDDEEEDEKFTAFTPQRLRPATHMADLERRVALHDAADDLRPSMEEYKRLSSKEKRQLRNKISARNFRNRRKEYISLLEEQVVDRDSVIDGLREQISTLSVQNKQLREEVRNAQGRSLGSVDVSKFLDALRAQDGSAHPNSPRLNAQSQRLNHKDMNNTGQYMSPFWGGATLPQKTPTLVA